MKSKKILYCIIILLLMVITVQYLIYNYDKPLPSDAVPNDMAAKQIADIIQVSILKVDASKLMDSTVNYDDLKEAWVVVINVPEIGFGSDWRVVIRKKDARILEVSQIN